MKTIRIVIPVLIATAATAFGCGDYESLNSPTVLAHVAISDDSQRAERAITKLRALGPEGLEALLTAHAGSFTNGATLDPKLRIAIERVSGQRDGHVARLFWHTDLEEAKAAAQKLNRPILSLRLLGRLDEELSCANSRFFRTALYPNSEINAYLRSNFVLHWESVRPAPRITVDYGDGRKLERTITGNSVHYVLAPDGWPVDAIPGLYGPKAFLRELQTAATTARQYAALENGARFEFLRRHHADALTKSLKEWSADLARAGAKPPAELARPDLEKLTTPQFWKAIAGLRQEDARLDAESRRLMRAKNSPAVDAGRLAVGKAMVEDPLLRAMGEFERSMAEDTVRNEYQLRSQVREWFIQGGLEVSEVKRLNNRVYAELFLMPSWDPWLGLRPPGALSGVELDGASLANIPGFR